MFCMKCGREIEEGQVFCLECQRVMAKYPVKPGTVVQLPNRREPAPVRKSFGRRKTQTPEDQIRKLKKTLRFTVVLWLITLLLLCAALIPAISYITGQEHFLPGQNYSVIETTTPAET